MLKNTGRFCLLYDPVALTFAAQGLENVAEVMAQGEVFQHLCIDSGEFFRGGHIDMADLCQTGDARAGVEYVQGGHAVAHVAVMQHKLTIGGMRIPGTDGRYGQCSAMKTGV